MDGFNYSMKAIPTTFAGVRMRSRLEARWASFFTNCGWKWTYEPFDTDGWAPDFTLHMPAGDIYVEVKPLLTRNVMDVFLGVAGPLVTGANVRALLVGSNLDFANGGAGAACIGVGIDRPVVGVDGVIIDNIHIGCCGGSQSRLCKGGMVSMSTAILDFTCWVCGDYGGNPSHDAVTAGVDEKWADACNQTQWRG